MNPTFSAIVEMVGLEAIGLKGKAFIYGTFRGTETYIIIYIVRMLPFQILDNKLCRAICW